VASARGAVLARVALSQELRPGTAFLPFHVGPLVRPDGWANALTARALDPDSFQPELKHTAVRVQPAGPVAVAGGALAAAVVRALCDGGRPARHVGLDELARLPETVLAVAVAEAALTAEPWWEVATSPPPPGGTVLLDLAAGPEPLAALPALAGAGWEVGWRHERWLPEPVRELVARHLPAGGETAALVVGGPAASPPLEAPPGVLILEPGGRLGRYAPLSADPATLAVYLAGGREEPRRALRRVAAGLGPRTSLLVAGEPLGDPERDREQGVDLLVHEDRAAGTAQVWRLTDGQVLGVAAVLAPPVIEDAEALWLADPEPGLLRRRFPLR
jgi:hypothetical protein